MLKSAVGREGGMEEGRGGGREGGREGGRKKKERMHLNEEEHMMNISFFIRTS